MSGHLCLKWNNHSAAFLKGISNFQTKERFCDATIICQGKFFPVHRIILSTCSEYFDEIFDRMQCQHPYIVFKDIEPSEMEMLLNYMYQGEVNVIQEVLPSLIKAAEALKIKGLAVPDDEDSSTVSPGKKKGTPASEKSLSKKRFEDRKRRRELPDSNVRAPSLDEENYPECDIATGSTELNFLDENPEYHKAKAVKTEPSDSIEYNTGEYGVAPFSDRDSSHLLQTATGNNEENVFVNFFQGENPASYIKSEQEDPSENTFVDEASTWQEISDGNRLQDVSSSNSSQQEDMSKAKSTADSDGSVSRVVFADSSERFPERDLRLPLFQKSFNSQGIAVFRCPYCGYESFNNQHVKNHVRYKHTGERPYPCALCSKGFVKNVDLKRHMRIHTGEKPFQCPKCKKLFRHKDSLKYHLLKVNQCQRINV